LFVVEWLIVPGERCPTTPALIAHPEKAARCKHLPRIYQGTKPLMQKDREHIGEAPFLVVGHTSRRPDCMTNFFARAYLLSIFLLVLAAM
jgi:hypothetical protein